MKGEWAVLSSFGGWLRTCGRLLCFFCLCSFACMSCLVHCLLFTLCLLYILRFLRFASLDLASLLDFLRFACLLDIAFILALTFAHSGGWDCLCLTAWIPCLCCWWCGLILLGDLTIFSFIAYHAHLWLHPAKSLTYGFWTVAGLLLVCFRFCLCCLSCLSCLSCLCWLFCLGCLSCLSLRLPSFPRRVFLFLFILQPLLLQAIHNLSAQSSWEPTYWTFPLKKKHLKQKHLKFGWSGRDINLYPVQGTGMRSPSSPLPVVGSLILGPSSSPWVASGGHQASSTPASGTASGTASGA